MQFDSPTCGGAVLSCTHPPCLNFQLARYPCWHHGVTVATEDGDLGFVTECKEECYDHVATLRATDPSYTTVSWSWANRTGYEKVFL